MKDVISVLPSFEYTKQTTRSWEWEYIGLTGNAGGQLQYETGVADLWSQAKQGKDVIIGVVDCGVWPESLSFNDDGMDPVPDSWKGICQAAEDFTAAHCNKKIIGARYLTVGFERQYGPIDTSINYRSPRDNYGHGTHAASIAAGRQVSNVAAIGGFAEGKASGGAPLARLAIYKACWHSSKYEPFRCMAVDVIAAMDAAIADGVDIISISLGFHNEPNDFIGLAALHNTHVLVVRAAGNNGPALGTVDSDVPWTMTVAASSSDGAFLSDIVLGNGLQIIGQSLSPHNLNVEMYPLVFPGDGQCVTNSLAPEMVKGKIVVCSSDGSRVRKGYDVARAGGVGLILIETKAQPQVDINVLKCETHVLPEAYVSYNEGIKILQYINSTKYPIATISRGWTQLHQKPAPYVAGFSSRGPNKFDPNILKPDITAPGMYILAAWSESSFPVPCENRHLKYHINSGTSMACPHVSGAAALIKAIHPDWSSAAIRSALMTTTWITDNLGEPIKDEEGDIATPFHFGAGLFRPIKAADPGLVYDSSYEDYVSYICSIGQQRLYNLESCPTNLPSPANLNYPSIAIPKLDNTVTIRRTLTNVASGTRRYSFKAQSPPEFHVKASPRTLCFINRIGQKHSFTITVTPLNYSAATKSEYAFGWYLWTDGHYVVRSPIAVHLQ
ncbi:hypothetical protein PTKIN_Ptkin01aG0096400 [Pterospermum kingtungense]